MVAALVSVKVNKARVCAIPKPSSNIGQRAVNWCRKHKMRLDPEQEFILKSMFGVRKDGRWQAFEVGINAPRQNGKGEILMARELFGIFVLKEKLVVHSAHEFKTSSRHFQRLEALIRSNPDLLAHMKTTYNEREDKHRVVGFRYSHGDEALEFADGSKIEFRTRTKSGMKGFDDVALLVLDEAQILSEWAHGAMVPTLRASTAERGPQLVYAGNAADQEKDDQAIVWTRLRERGIAGGDDALVYHEYSLDFEAPDEMPDEVAEDPERWAEVNWAIGRGRIREEHMHKELRTLGRRSFAVELLGVGDYPDTDIAGNSEIDMDAWADCEDEESVLKDPVVISFDVSPSRRTSICAAGLNTGGTHHVELIHSRAGTGWVPERLEELVDEHDVVEVVCDGFGPANVIGQQVEDAIGKRVRRLKTGEYADACGLFANEVGERKLRHPGHEVLTVAVRGARTRPLVDRWAWSRSKSKTDPGPLIASSIALWSAVDRNVGRRRELAIY